MMALYMHLATTLHSLPLDEISCIHVPRDERKRLPQGRRIHEFSCNNLDSPGPSITVASSVPVGGPLLIACKLLRRNKRGKRMCLFEIERKMAGRVAVLYHYPCPDGAFAALAAYLYHSRICVPAVFLPNTVYNPIKVEDLDGGAFDVFYLLDYVGPKGFASELCLKAKRVIVLDHHKTAYAALTANSFNNLVTNIDMRRSGAMIAFNYFIHHLQLDMTTTSNLVAAAKELTLVDQASLQRVRRLFDYIEDADLWKWNLPHSKAFSYGLSSLSIDYNANTNTNLFKQLLSLEASEVIAIGEKELLSNQLRLDAAVQSSFTIDLGQGLFGKCLVVESNDMTDLRSELGHQLASKSLASGLRPMGAVAYKVEGGDPDLVKVSLRSIEGEDTTQISEAYRGGGHAGASSFMMSQKTFDSWKGTQLRRMAGRNLCSVFKMQI